MENISGFGARVRLVASNTFPEGVDLTQFADDADPFDAPSLQIADKAMGVNGDLVTWSKATPVPVSLAMVPDSEDDQNLQALFAANRAAKDKQSAADEITITVVYPDGRALTYDGGVITDGPSAPGIASAGRKKTSVYQFAFESVS